MILAETSVWIDHFRKTEPALDQYLYEEKIVCHPYVVAELSLGSIKNRSRTLERLDKLNQLPVLRVSEVRSMIEQRKLFSRGVGFSDMAMLASCLLDGETRLWTRDKRLAAVADELGVGWPDEAA